MFWPGWLGVHDMGPDETHGIAWINIPLLDTEHWIYGRRICAVANEVLSHPFAIPLFVKFYNIF